MRRAVDGVVAAYLFFLEWAGAAIWQTRIDIGHSGERPMPSAVPAPSGSGGGPGRLCWVSG